MMEKVEFVEKLSFLYDISIPIGMEVFFLLSDSNNEEKILKADVDLDATTDLKLNFIDYISSKIINDEELFFGPISNAEDYNRSVYYYDLEQRPEKLASLYAVHNRENESYQEFEINSNNLSHIKGYIFRIGNGANQITIFKKHYPINLLKQDSFLGLIPRTDTQRFVKFDGNLVKLSDSFEFMIVDNELFVLSLKVFERNFGYDTIILDAAVGKIQFIEDAAIIENIEFLRELATDLKEAKRIMKIRSESPVLQLPFINIKNFIVGHEFLKKKIRFNSDETKINLHTKVSRGLIIKLLNDDYLKSELTQLLYDSQKKAKLEEEGEIEEEN